ncbi:exopolyphosphatase [Lysobacteraceae bacterium NML95-0200]|nr:exopolyphosphatase [Xanthomonadaceae bacterium NML95-0200]
MNTLRRTALSAPLPLEDGDLMAAIDLGSNSFHMIVARYVQGQIRVVDRIREMVRMADGLDAQGGLSAQVRERALQCLSRFGERIRDIPAERVRAIATNTVRKLKDAQAFLTPAEAALGHAIEVVAGREEARLVYLGVASAQPTEPGQRHLVMDIGGGSTECIIGTGLDAIERESLQMGCVATTRRFFPSGKLSRKKWQQALTEISAEFQQFAQHYRNIGWHDVIGSSGTIKAIGKICTEMKLTKGAITAQALPKIRERLLQADSLAAIDLPGLSAERQPVIAGGILILEAAFNALGIERMSVSRAAMREGILYDMIGRGSGDDPRDAAIDLMMARYAVDEAQAERVEATAMQLFDQVAARWELQAEDRAKLGWAAWLHEIGLAVAHSQHHVHGAYLLEHSDIPGFTRQQQQVLAVLVRCQRRSIPKNAFNAIPERLLLPTRRITALLRLAVVLNRSHKARDLSVARLQANASQLTLSLPRDWLAAKPLLKSDLESQPHDLRALGIELHIQED